eukprot:6487431-Amphidinium_carterae.1
MQIHLPTREPALVQRQGVVTAMSLAAWPPAVSRLAVVRVLKERRPHRVASDCKGALHAVQLGHAHLTQQAVAEGRSRGNQEADVVANLGAAEHEPHDPPEGWELRSETSGGTCCPKLRGSRCRVRLPTPVRRSRSPHLSFSGGPA